MVEKKKIKDKRELNEMSTRHNPNKLPPQIPIHVKSGARVLTRGPPHSIRAHTDLDIGTTQQPIYHK